ncbi:flagellar P-ring protein [Escherichia coli]|nr:flagellar P-ring protein [Escherichia coli]
MIKFLSALILLLVTTAVQAERIRDLTSVQGVRQNSLIGYGLVVGLMVQVTRQLRRRLPHKRLITCSHSWELPFRRALICS